MPVALRGAGDRWCMVVVSSCREMLGQVPQRAQPLPPVASVEAGTLGGLPGTTRRKAGTTSNHHAPYGWGYTRATMGPTEGSGRASASGPQKRPPSSDCSLQLGCMKPESLVIADQNAAVNTFPGLVHTARHTMGVGNARSRCPNREEGAAEGGPGDWGEVVTR